MADRALFHYRLVKSPTETATERETERLFSTGSTFLGILPRVAQRRCITSGFKHSQRLFRSLFSHNKEWKQHG